MSASEPLRVAVLLSGSGTSLENLFEHIIWNCNAVVLFHLAPSFDGIECFHYLTVASYPPSDYPNNQLGRRGSQRPQRPVGVDSVD